MINVLLKEICIEDMEHNYIKMGITEEFYKHGACALEIKVDRLLIQDTLWMLYGELRSFLIQLEKMYETMKGTALLMESEGCLEACYTLDRRGYVYIDCTYRGSSNRKVEVHFELISTQPQMAETIEAIRVTLNSK